MQFSKLTQALIASRRADALSLAEKLQNVEKEKEEADKAVEAAQQALLKEQAENAIMQAMLIQLKIPLPDAVA